MTTSWVGSHHRAIRALAVVCTVALAAALGLVRDSMTQSTAAMVLVLAVVAAAATGDRWAGVLAAVTAALGSNYVLTAPVPAGGSALGHFRVTTASRIVRPGRERPRVCYLAASTVGPGETTRG